MMTHITDCDKPTGISDYNIVQHTFNSTCKMMNEYGLKEEYYHLTI